MRRSKVFLPANLRTLAVSVCVGILLYLLVLSANFPPELSDNGEEADRDEEGNDAAASSSSFPYPSVCLSKKYFESGNLSSSEFAAKKKPLPPLFIVTPTYRRAEQLAELTRLAQTLDGSSVDGNLHWIVAEDARECSASVKSLMMRFGESGSSYTLLAAPMPKKFRHPDRIKKFGLPRGVAGRRAGLKWISQNTSPDDPGVIYFADDDNSYDRRLFAQIRGTRRISMFPVGLLRPAGVRGPLVAGNTGKVVGFVGSRRPERKFPVDMAGFAFSVRMLHEKEPKMPYKATFEEEGFLRSMQVEYSDIEPLASNCTEILVWHTMTAAPQPIGFDGSLPEDKDIGGSNLEELLDNMIQTGLAFLDGKASRALPVCIGKTCA